MPTDPDAAGRALLGLQNNLSIIPKISESVSRDDHIMATNKIIDQGLKSVTDIKALQTSLTAATATIPAITKSVDANTWTVIDVGGVFKRYHATVSVSVTVAAGQRNSWGNVLAPVGRATTSFRIFAAYEGGFAGHAVLGLETGTGSYWTLEIGNQYSGGSLTFTGVVHCLLEEI